MNGCQMSWALNFGCIHSVELFALCKAFKGVINLLSGYCLLCTDSLNAIQGSESPEHIHPLILALCMSFRSLRGV